MPHLIHVCNHHLDGYGHVNNARYLEFLEEARWAFFRQHALAGCLKSVQLLVVRADIRYRRAAFADDVLTVDCRIAAVRPRQVLMRQNVSNGAGQTLAEADITLLPAQNGKACRLPENLYFPLISLQENP